jgi:hypothetical protein
MSEATTIPEYVRYKANCGPNGWEVDEAARHWLRDSIKPHMPLADINAGIHRQVCRSKANRLCARCWTKFRFHSQKVFYEYAGLPWHQLELLPQYADDIAPFFYPQGFNNSSRVLNGQETNSCQFCAILVAFSIELTQGAVHRGDNQEEMMQSLTSIDFGYGLQRVHILGQ